MIYTNKNKFWTDESGASVPYDRVTKQERDRERSAKKVLDAATEVNKKLNDVKELIKELSYEAYSAAAEKNGTSPNPAGGFTWYNFDRSIKIEVSVSEPVTFDDITIKSAKEKLDSFLDNSITSEIDFVKDLVRDAFSTTRGKLDPKKVLGLLKYRARISNVVFHEALDLIEQAQRRPKTKTYYRVWLKDENGKYQNIELNFSNV